MRAVARRELTQDNLYLSILMPGLTLPPFPDTVRTHPLLVIDYDLLKIGDAEEINKLWKAATELGFW